MRQFRAANELVTQRRTFDCGIAALAMTSHVPYEDVYVAAVSVAKRGITSGLNVKQLQQVAVKLGRKLKRVDYRRVDLEEDSGVLGLNYPKTDIGHWVVLWRGTLIDPSDLSVWDAEDYMKANKARPGTLLVET